MDMLLRNRLKKILVPYGFADTKTEYLSVYISTLKNGGLLRNILLFQHGQIDRQKVLIYADCRGQKWSKEYNVPQSSKTPFYRSTQHRKSGQEVFNLLPAFCCNLSASR